MRLDAMAAARLAEADRLEAQLNEIAEAEQFITMLQAEQAMRVAEYADSRRAFDRASRSGWNSDSQRIVALELADARRTSIGVAERHLADSLFLVESMPAVFERFEAGDISLPAAQAVAHEATVLRREALALADIVIAEEITDVPVSQARTLARTRAFEIDPDAALTACMEARDRRGVWAGPAVEPGMGRLTALVPAEQASACWHALDGHARAAKADGDLRAVSAIMADTLVERVTGQRRADEVAVNVNLVMSDLTLLGGYDRPVAIAGMGPLPAPVGRLLATGKSAWLRRLLTDPVDGTVTSADSRRRRFDGALRDLIVARDQRCRCCGAPIVDIDHICDYCVGGITSAANGQGLCQRCNHMKQHEDLCVEAVYVDRLSRRRSEHRSAALVRFTTPIGHQVLSHAPPALGRGTANRAVLQNRRALTAQLQPANGCCTPTERPREPEGVVAAPPVCVTPLETIFWQSLHAA